MIRNVKDLSSDQKMVIENLLGRQILDDETISVRAVHPPALSDQRRLELTQQMERFFAEVDSHREPGSADEADEIIAEAMRSVRPSYRPRQ